MQVPIVLPDIPGAAQASGSGPPAEGGSSASAPSGVFALLLAQETAPQVAQALGQPVLVLPDGTISLEFDPASIPEGALVVNPPAEGTIASLVDMAEEIVPDPSEVPDDTLVTDLSAPPTSGEVLSEIAQESTMLTSAAAQETPEANAAASTDVVEVVSNAPPEEAAPAGTLVSKAVHTVAQGGAEAGSVEVAEETAGLVASRAEYRVAPAKAAPPPEAVATAEQVSAVGVSKGEAAVGEVQETASGQAVDPAVLLPEEEVVVVAESAATASSEVEVTLVGARNGHLAAAKAEAVPESSAEPKAGDVPAAVQSDKPDAVSVTAKAEALSKPFAETQEKAALALEAEAADSGSRDEALVELATARVTGKTPVLGNETAKMAGQAEHAAASGNVDASQGTPPEAQASFTQAIATASSGKAAEATEVVEQAWVASSDRPTLETLGAHTVRSVRYLVSREEQSFRMRLVPESLGEMRIEVTSSSDAIQVKLISPNAAVRGVLEGQVEGLRDALAREGIDVSRLTVTADAGSSTTPGDYGGREAHDFSGASRRSSHPNYSLSRQAPMGPAPPGRHAHYEGALNVYA